MILNKAVTDLDSHNLPAIDMHICMYTYSFFLQVNVFSRTVPIQGYTSLRPPILLAGKVSLNVPHALNQTTKLSSIHFAGSCSWLLEEFEVGPVLETRLKRLYF